jgi:predicted nucleic acid-binding protein
MSEYFFDTSALQHRYLTSTYSRRVKLIISRSDSRCYISEWTVAEMASTFARHCRRQRLTVANFDALLKRFLADIATNRLTVVATPKRGFLRTQQLFRFAGVKQALHLATGDCLIAMCAMEIAHQNQERLRFMTSDWKLFNIIRGLDAFVSVCDCELLGDTKDGSPGRA